ncbi:hypothetical protein [Streptacidiphilus rugosus]|nr:hypothetical protein [Streptacidiphilus rugosus]
MSGPPLPGIDANPEPDAKARPVCTDIRLPEPPRGEQAETSPGL